MNYEAFIARFEKVKPTAKGVMAKCPAHEDGSASLSIGRANDGGVLVKCFAGCSAESICGAMGLTVKDLFAKQVAPQKPFVPLRTEKEEEPKEKPVVDKIYSYTDSIGRELYQAVRLKPKSFRQRHAVDGKWIWNMDGVERVLYRLPMVTASETVWIVEGEKDADNLCSLGFTATCNVGGAGKWLDGYSEALAGKNVVICGDNDKPGKNHVELVFDSIAKKAKMVKIIKLPESVKDVSDYIATFSDEKDAKKALDDLEQLAVPHLAGVKLPVFSMADISPLYKKQVDAAGHVKLDLGKWIPSFRRIRPLIPGELCLIIGDTGTGKTAMLQNIAITSGLESLLFEMELPMELLFERFFALRAKVSCRDIELEYKSNGAFDSDAIMQQFPKIYICPESKMTLDALESVVMKSELKIGTKPALVLIDYVQLIQGSGSRYEKTSDVAEGLKILAKTTQTIVVVTSQVSRQSDEEIGLHSAKDSGSLENSAGLVIGAWRDQSDAQLLKMKVLKCTKGGAGLTVDCDFDGEKMLICERM